MISIDHPLGRLVLVAPPQLPPESRLAPILEVAPPLSPIGWDSVALLDEERALFEALSEARRPTWLAGRSALIEALAAIGAPREVIGADRRGAPVVPQGYRGSIAHKSMLAGAIAARLNGAHLGVDVELLRAPRVAIGPKVLTEAELAEGGDPVIAVLGRFAIKEAIYKAIDPYVGRYVGFREAELLDLVVPPISPIEAPVFVETGAVMTMARGEGPFKVEAWWARTAQFAVAAARVSAS